jgi:hypothetical protein
VNGKIVKIISLTGFLLLVLYASEAFSAIPAPPGGVTTQMTHDITVQLEGTYWDCGSVDFTLVNPPVLIYMVNFSTAACAASGTITATLVFQASASSSPAGHVISSIEVRTVQIRVTDGQGNAAIASFDLSVEFWESLGL